MALDTLKNWQGQKFQGKIYVVFHVNYVVLSRFSVHVIGPYDSSQVLSTKEIYSVLHATSEVSAYYLNKYNRLFMAF